MSEEKTTIALLGSRARISNPVLVRLSSEKDPSLATLILKINFGSRRKGLIFSLTVSVSP